MVEQPVTELVLIRHGETEWNSQHRCQGHLDIPLSEHGLAQSKAVAAYVAQQTWDALYSSDLLRAAMTAEQIAATTQMHIVKDERLRERKLGILQGLTHKEFAERYPEEYRLFYSEDSEWRIPEGESQREASERIVEACRDIAVNHPGERVLVVTHGGCIGYMMKWVMGLPAHAQRRWSIYNCGLHTFHVRGDGWRMVRWGETAYLSDTPALDGVSI